MEIVIIPFLGFIVKKSKSEAHNCWSELGWPTRLVKKVTESRLETSQASYGRGKMVHVLGKNVKVRLGKVRLG